MPEVFAIMLPVMVLVIIFTFVLLLKIVKAVSNRGASRQQLAELNRTLQQIQTEITEIKSQLADVVISLHDRV